MLAMGPRVIMRCCNCMRARIARSWHESATSCSAKKSTALLSSRCACRVATTSPRKWTDMSLRASAATSAMNQH